MSTQAPKAKMWHIDIGSAGITVSRSGQTTVYENSDGAVVATIVKAGPYNVRRYFSPDEFSFIAVGTLDAAEKIAVRHALRFS